MNASATLARRSNDAALDAVAAALADGTRRDLLRLVRHDEQSAGNLAAAFPHISRPAVEVRPSGRHRLYRARTDALAPVSRFIDEMWGDRLQRLKRAAERAEGGR